MSQGTTAITERMMGVAALFVIYGLTLGVSEKVFDHYLPRKPTSARTDISTPVPGAE